MMQMVMAIESNNNQFLDKNKSPEQGTHMLGKVFVLLFMTLVISAMLWLMQPGTLPIKQVHIEGEFSRLDTNKMQSLVTKNVKGGFFNIDVAAIRNTLMTLPWVKEVSVHRVWPDAIRVVVSEQVALATWNDNGLVSNQGTYFFPEKDSFPSGLPALFGPEDARGVVLEKFNVMNEKYNLPVVELHLNERRAWSFKLYSGLTVILGRREFENRIERFVQAVANNLGEKLSTAEEIDMRYTNGFAVRWKQGVPENLESGVKK